jgi:hypothetical protein
MLVEVRVQKSAAVLTAALNFFMRRNNSANDGEICSKDSSPTGTALINSLKADSNTTYHGDLPAVNGQTKNG